MVFKVMKLGDHLGEKEKKNEGWISPVDLQHLEVESRGKASKREWDWVANEARKKLEKRDTMEAKIEKCLQKKETANCAKCSWEIE